MKRKLTKRNKAKLTLEFRYGFVRELFRRNRLSKHASRKAAKYGTYEGEGEKVFPGSKFTVYPVLSRKDGELLYYSVSMEVEDE